MFIYGLKDPISQQVRYVGRTNDLERRYKEHLRSDRTASSYKRNWIRSLLSKNIKPEMVVLAEVSNLEAESVEDFYIKQFQNLTNTTWRGGKAGCIAGAERKELRKAIIGKNIQTGEEIRFDGIYSIPAPFSGDCISKCLRHETTHHKNFYWRYANQAFIDPTTVRVRSQGYGVIRIDTSGIEKYYLKVTDAVKEGFSSSGVQRCAAGTYKQHGGYSWRFATVDDKVKYTGNAVKEAFQRNKKRSV